MMSVIEEIFGVYMPIDGGVNYGYIAAVVVFCVVLYCSFRILGIALGGKR